MFDTTDSSTSMNNDDSKNTKISAKFINGIEKITLSSDEFAIGIWLFRYSKKHKYYYQNGIYRDGFLKLIHSLGYYKRYQPNGTNPFLIRDQNGIIEEIQTVHLKDHVFNPKNIQFQDLYFEYENSKGEIFTISQTEKSLREIYLKQYHNIINENFLEHLPTHSKPFLKDTRDSTFLYFENYICKITSEGHGRVEYSDLGGYCIWKDQIIQKNFTYVEDSTAGHFETFISNVSNNDPARIDTFKSAIGYLMNNFSDPANTRAVIFNDEEITDLKTPQGGTGKGLASNALKQIRVVTKFDGKKFEVTDKFRWQSITLYTQIVWIDDAHRKLGFEVFHSVISDGWNIEKKHQPELFIPPQDGPKLLLTSNTMIEGEGNTNARRQFIIEFSPYYSRKQRDGIKEPIRTEHGCTFFDDNDWSELEWNKFFSYMVDCSFLFHKYGLIPHKPINLNHNKLRQGTCSEFADWLAEGNIPLNEKFDAGEKLAEFKILYGDEILQRKFNDWLKKYADFNNYTFSKQKSNGKLYITIQSVPK